MTTLRSGALAYELKDSSWLSPRAAQYALDQLWHLSAGTIHYEGDSLVHIGACEKDQPVSLLAPRAMIHGFIDQDSVLPTGSARVIPDAELPILLLSPGADRTMPVVRREDDAVRFDVDIVATAFFLLSRWEEAKGTVRDAHGRFPARASLSFKAGLLDRPIVDEWALVIRAWLRALAPRLPLDVPEFRLSVSHDMDEPLRYPRNRTILGRAVDSARRGELTVIPSEVARGIRSRLRKDTDPYYVGFKELLDSTDRLMVNASFFFMAADRSEYESGYAIEHPPTATC